MIKKMIGIIILVLLLTSGVSVFSSTISTNQKENRIIRSNGVIIVDLRGNGNYTTIQEAIDNASSGDTIYVWKGTYYGNLVINKTLTLIGNHSKNVTIIGETEDIVVNITANYVNISGFTIRGKDFYMRDSGIQLNNVSSCNISNNIFNDNRRGVHLYNSSKNKIINNTFGPSNQAIGIFSIFSNYNFIANNTCYSCNDDGMRIKYSTNNIFINNSCVDGSDFGLFLYYSPNNRVIRNNCSENLNEGIYLINSEKSTIDDNIFINNPMALYIRNSPNSTITNNYCENKYTGIAITNSSYSIILNNSCINNSCGISIGGSRNNKVMNNICSNNRAVGISLSYSSNNIIKKNNVNNNIWKPQPAHYEGHGISLIYSNFNILSNNSCNFNTNDGINLVYSNSNTIKNNIIKSNGESGIRLWDSYNSIIKSNHMASSGIHICETSLSNWNTQTIDDQNTINGKPVYYLKNKAGIDIPKNIGQIILGNCSNIDIENHRLNNTSSGIQVGYSTGVRIRNNSCVNNSIDGMFIYRSESNIIQNNSCSSNNRFGIHLYYFRYGIVINNSVDSNRNAGIYLHDSNLNTIENNNFTINDNGLIIDCSEHNYLNYNTFHHNSKFGLKIINSNTKYNKIYYNNFIENNNGSTQAMDNGTNNLWNSLVWGNYWSDWSKPDEDLDGVVDKPYSISGSAGAKDLYPLTKPYDSSKDNFEHFFQNITLGLELYEYRYYSNDNITGHLTITNNNYFDIYNIDPSVIGTNISLLPLIVVKISNRDSEEVYYTRFGDIFTIENYSKMIINFSLTEFYYNEVGSGKSFKLPIGNFSLSLNINVYITNDSYSVLNSNSDSFQIVKPTSESENIIIKLNLSKRRYISGEPIIGSINITNKNPFDIELNNQPVQTTGKTYFQIQSKDNNNEYRVYYKYPLEWIVKANSNTIVYFAISEFIKLPMPSKEVNYTTLAPGNYSIYTYFYFENSEKIRSNEDHFEIIEVDIQDVENIEITLFLDKLEFFEDEPITGKVIIKNNNLFNISLNNFEVQMNPRYFFNIYSLDSSNQFGGISENNFENLMINAKVNAIFEFSIHECIDVELSINKQVNITKLKKGDYSIHSFFYYGYMTNHTILNSNISYFKIISNDSSSIDGPSDGPSNGRIGYSESFIAGSAVLITVVIVLISTIFVLNTEMGKYSFFSAISPLYTKTRKKKKDHEYGYIKGSVRGYIVGNPGESYNNIKRVLELPNGTLAYYLKVLEREGIIRSERDGFLRRFYPAKGTITSDVIELSDIQQTIKSVIQDFPGISQKDILSRLDISQQKLNYHIKLMVDARIIRLEREGKVTKCFIIEEVS